jgi:pimeloyl-ACP methyl ester carboxylesterase
METSINPGKFSAGLTLGVGAGWIIAQQLWVLRLLSKIDVRQSLARYKNNGPRGSTVIEESETNLYFKRHTLEDGIERIAYLPRQRRYQTPIFMQHGMFHGAWSWEPWQQLLAEWGWASVAASLPGHAGSPEQRPISRCTLDYYLGFMQAEIDRLPRRPVVMGHSMGGALTQWYLKYVGDLPAAVLVASWVADSPLRDNLIGMLRLDPLLFPLCSWSWNATPWIRTPRHAARLFLSERAIPAPEELQTRLGPESLILV